jgi:hypothetical protein
MTSDEKVGMYMIKTKHKTNWTRDVINFDSFKKNNKC